MLSLTLSILSWTYQGGVWVTFRELPKVFSRNLCLAEMVLLMRISSLNFVQVPKAMCFGHTYKVSAWNSHHKCDFWHCIFMQDYFGEVQKCLWNKPQAPFWLTIFPSNSKFNENLQCSCSLHMKLITMTFCTYEDSNTVLACAKFRCDQLNLFETGALLILVKFLIQLKYYFWYQNNDFPVYPKKLSWFIRHLSDRLYMFYSNLWNL